MIGATKDSALTAKHGAGPAVVNIAPPIAGPRTREVLSTTSNKLMALARRSRPTRSTTYTCRAGLSTALTVPVIAEIRRIAVSPA